MIRQKARDTTRELGIGDDRFKASSGWIENFKQRHGIRKGIWLGVGGRRTSMALRSSMRPPSTTPDQDKLTMTFQIVQEETNVVQPPLSPEVVQPSPTIESTPAGQESPPAANMDAPPAQDMLWQQDHQGLPSELYDDNTPVATEPHSGFSAPYNNISTQGAPMDHVEGVIKQQQQHLNHDLLTSPHDMGISQHDMGTSQHDMAPPQHDIAPSQHEMMGQQAMGHDEMSMDYLQYREVCAPANTIDQCQPSYLEAPDELPVPLVSVAEANYAVDKILTFLRTQGEGLATDDQANALYNLQRTLWLTEHQVTTSSVLHHHDAMSMHPQEAATSSGTWGM